MRIVKAEILWTRVCDLSCHYCAMVDGRTNIPSLQEWKLGVDELKRLGCQFIAFYGAEPLKDQVEKLAEVIAYAENSGIATTVITSGLVKDFRSKLELLYSHGARSLSMSYDIVPLDRYSEKKSRHTIDSLLFFRSLGLVRDVAAIVTLTRHNFRELPSTIIRLSNLGIWAFFDFIHWDRGQPGTKCKERDPSLSFTREDLLDLSDILCKVVELKTQEYLCHTSTPFIEMMSRDEFSLLLRYDWNCAKEKGFPAWVTIDCDGYVYCCDDFQSRPTKPFSMLKISSEWEEFSQYWQQQVLSICPGCCWNTHIDACLVKQGRVSINDYIHGRDSVR